MPQPIHPLFAAGDATDDEVLATYPDGSAAVAFRATTGGPSLFVGVPGLTSDLLRLIARKAGVHLFTETDCNVYASGPFLALHTTQRGALDLSLPRSGPVWDALTGEQVGTGPRLSLTVERAQTRVLRY